MKVKLQQRSLTITEERLSETCKYRQWYGTFKDLKLVEVFKTIEQTLLGTKRFMQPIRNFESL
jgi:hypothetical protein